MSHSNSPSTSSLAPSSKTPPVSNNLAEPPNRFRGFLQGKTRIVIAWGFAAWLLFQARVFPSLPGAALCFLGATIRYWASGYLRKDSRPAVGGPYAWVRNPLYLGTYLMAVGTAWSIEDPFLIGTVTVVFALVYHFIILDEETKLHKIFGPAYARYQSLVPRFFPRILPFGPASSEALLEVNPESSHHSLSWDLMRKNKAYEAYLSFVGLMAGVTLAAYLWSL